MSLALLQTCPTEWERPTWSGCCTVQKLDIIKMDTDPRPNGVTSDYLKHCHCLGAYIIPSRPPSITMKKNYFKKLK